MHSSLLPTHVRLCQSLRVGPLFADFSGDFDPTTLGQLGNHTHQPLKRFERLRAAWDPHVRHGDQCPAFAALGEGWEDGVLVREARRHLPRTSR